MGERIGGILFFSQQFRFKKTKKAIFALNLFSNGDGKEFNA